MLLIKKNFLQRKLVCLLLNLHDIFVVMCLYHLSRRYAQLMCSVITLQSGSSLNNSSNAASGGNSDFGIGGGGESMMLQDVNLMRTEMIGECTCSYSRL
jgi:hypothetical protein